MSPPRPSNPRNRLGAVVFVVAALGAVLAVTPATAPFGFLLCLLAVVPAVVAYRRVRRGVAAGRRRSVAALVMAPLFTVVAVSVGVAAAPPHPPAAAVTAVDAATPRGPGGALVPVLAPVDAPATGPVDAVAPVATAPVVAQTDPAPVVGHAPVVVVAVPAAPARHTPAPAAPVATPAPPPPPPAAASSCDETTHYVNTDGTCVLRPVQADTPPAGATARCEDGTYSSSQHRQGTCSRHGGVARWL